MRAALFFLLAPRLAFAQPFVAGEINEPGARAPLAQPYRLRADAVGQARTPTGVIMLQGQGAPTEWATGEALIWAGTGELGEEADALVARVSLRDPGHLGELHLGRMIVGPGAIRPLHLDGASGLLRLPWRMTLEAFGGLSVAPRFGDRDYDWAAGGRVAQAFGDAATVGVAYLQRRQGGRLADSELGGDVAVHFGPDVDLVGRAAWDVESPGLSEALGSLSYHPGDAWRFEIYAAHRSPSRILPATSLFSVLGDVPAQRLAGRVRWRAAPRLDLVLDGGARTFEASVGEIVRLRAVLRLDALGASMVGAELRRNGGPADVAFSGARLIGRWQITGAWLVATELELVRPDQPSAPDDRGVVQTTRGLTSAPSRGALWPWGIVSLEWRPAPAWVLAAALEGSATSEYEVALDGLLRVTWRWGGGS